MKHFPKLRGSKDGYLVVVLVVITCIFAFININWLNQDASPVPAGDENTIMARTLRFVDRLTTEGFQLDMIGQLSHYGRPPLYQLLSVPFVLIFGRSMDSGVYVNTLFYILLMVATYNLGKQAHSREAGLLAAILVGTYPTMVRIAHLYRPSFALAACTALTMWLLLTLVATRSIKYAWWTNLSLAFGLFLHPMFAFGVPVGVGLAYLYLVLSDEAGGRLSHLRNLPGWLWEKLKQPLFLKGILPSGLLAVALVLSWYLTNGSWLFDTMLNRSSSEMADLRGFDTLIMGLQGDYPPLLIYALNLPQAVSTVFAVLAAIGLVYALINRSMPALALAGTFILSYLLLSSRATLGWRYFALILPIVAVLSSTWIFSLRSKKLVALLATTTLAVATFNLLIVTGNLSAGFDPLVRLLGGVPANSRPCTLAAYALFCSDAPQTDPWPVSDVLEIIVADPACDETAADRFCELLVVSTNPYFQFPVFWYQLAQDFPDRWIWIGGVAKTIPNINSLLEFDYLLYQDIPAKGIGWQNKALLDILRSTKTRFWEAHQEVSEFSLPDGTKAILTKRIKPLSFDEASQALALVKFPDDETKNYMELVTLSPLAALEGKVSQSQALCSSALEFSKKSPLLATFDSSMYADMGRVHYLCGNLDAAFDAYTSALEILDTDASYHYGLALVYLEQNQVDKARQEFELTIQNSPKSSYAFLAQEWLEQNK